MATRCAKVLCDRALSSARAKTLSLSISPEQRDRARLAFAMQPLLEARIQPVVRGGGFPKHMLHVADGNA
jgi:hypothetical protein